MGNGNSKFNPATDLGDLTGRIAVVTGGNRGIGFHTVRHLAQRGAKVYLGARSEASAKEAIEKITDGLDPGVGEVVWLKVDLSHPKLAKEAAEELLSRETRLDILVNNAGGMPGDERTNGGISVITTVNYLSPFVFTRTLTPLLTETAKRPNSDVRIVNVASEVHKITPSSTIRFRTKEELSPTYRRPMPNFFLYGHSKFCVISWTNTLQRQFDMLNVSIICTSVHPGSVDTFSYKFPFQSITSPPMRWMMATPEEGAFTSLFAAASPVVVKDKDKYQGAYIKPFGVVAEPLKEAINQELGEELWKTTEEVVKQMGVE